MMFTNKTELGFEDFVIDKLNNADRTWSRMNKRPRPGSGGQQKWETQTALK